MFPFICVVRPSFQTLRNWLPIQFSGGRKRNCGTVPSCSSTATLAVGPLAADDLIFFLFHFRYFSLLLDVKIQWRILQFVPHIHAPNLLNWLFTLNPNRKEIHNYFKPLFWAVKVWKSFDDEVKINNTPLIDVPISLLTGSILFSSRGTNARAC